VLKILFLEGMLLYLEKSLGHMKYWCTDVFFLSIGSSGAEGTFAQNLLELICITPNQPRIALTPISHSVDSTGATDFFI
jgi:hypothetical protein